MHIQVHAYFDIKYEYTYVHVHVASLLPTIQ